MLNPTDTDTGRIKSGAKPAASNDSGKGDQPKGKHPLAEVPHPEIREAARAVWESWTNERGDAIDEAEALFVLQSVAGALADAVSGRDLTIGSKASSILGRRFLELLRSQLVLGWTTGTTSLKEQDFIEMIVAGERVQRAIEPNWSDYFSSRLSGPDGLELVVQLAHDLRSPLTSILFLAETLQRGQSGEVNELQHRQLGLVYGAALGLSSVASDVIELARGGDRLVDDRPTPFSVTEVLESVQDIVRPIAAEKGLSIRVRPPATDHRLGHPLALSRVLLNLTTNALKFTDEGYVELSVRATSMTDAEFSVRDTGNGINPAAMDSLYQPFRRAQGREGYCFSGTGLGLAICRRLVSAMGSELQVETRPGWGTRFFFTIELAPSH